MACTYAIQIPQLGFYLDDWVSIASYDQGGEEGLLAFGINDSRPFAAWVTAKFFAVLGTGVLQWQLITLFWRFAAAMTSLLLLRSIWPERKVMAGFISLLFGVFPYFKHQAICIAYFMILFQYFVVLLSFLLTVKALQTRNMGIKVLLFVLSYAASLFHLSCLEYYLSLKNDQLKPNTGRYARISSTTREMYYAAGGTADVGHSDDGQRSQAWLGEVGRLYREAWNNDRNFLIYAWAKANL